MKKREREGERVTEWGLSICKTNFNYQIYLVVGYFEECRMENIWNYMIHQNEKESFSHPCSKLYSYITITNSISCEAYIIREFSLLFGNIDYFECEIFFGRAIDRGIIVVRHRFSNIFVTAIETNKYFPNSQKFFLKTNWLKDLFLIHMSLVSLMNITFKFQIGW